MAKNSIDAYGASGKSNVLFFAPETLHLVADPAHPLYDDRVHLPLDEGMVLNIMDQGVLEPIIVWKDPETGNVCVVDGRQRVRHTVEANKRLAEHGKPLLQVPGVTKRGSPIRMSQAMVSANEIRRADTPMGRAKKMAALMGRGHDENDLALLFGCSTATVRNTLALLDCTQVTQAAVEAGQINVTHARQLVDLPPDEQRTKVGELIQAGDGAKPHERARKQRQIMTGQEQPRMRTRKQISAALETAAGDYALALRWVLGHESDSHDSAQPGEQHQEATQ